MTSNSILQENAHKMTFYSILRHGYYSKSYKSVRAVIVSMYVHRRTPVLVVKTKGYPSLMIMIDAEIITSRPSPEVVFGR